MLVANASQTNGVAGYYTSKLSALGWGTASPVTANIATSTSAVYYVSGQQGAAQSVATSLGLSASAVQPVGTQTPVGQLTPGVDVLVVVGNDLAARVPAGGG